MLLVQVVIIKLRNPINLEEFEVSVIENVSTPYKVFIIIMYPFFRSIVV